MEGDAHPKTEEKEPVEAVSQSEKMYKPYRKLEEPDDDHLPELVTDHDHTSPKIALSSEYAAYDGLETVSPAPYSDSPGPVFLKHEDQRQYQSPSTNLEFDDARTKEPPNTRKRKLWFILVSLIVIALIAVIVGATLGSILHKKSNNTSPSTPTAPSAGNTDSNSTDNFDIGSQSNLGASNGTGLAAVRLADANPQQFLAYFQLNNGTVVEQHYSNTSVSSLGPSSTNLTGYAGNAMNIANISSNSPLSATSYTDTTTGTQTVSRVELCKLQRVEV